jgi:hypothetical protein
MRRMTRWLLDMTWPQAAGSSRRRLEAASTHRILIHD